MDGRCFLRVTYRAAKHWIDIQSSPRRACRGFPMRPRVDPFLIVQVWNLLVLFFAIWHGHSNHFCFYGVQAATSQSGHSNLCFYAVQDCRLPALKSLKSLQTPQTVCSSSQKPRPRASQTLCGSSQKPQPRRNLRLQVAAGPAPEPSGNLRNLPKPSGKLRNSPELSGTCACHPHRHTPEPT